MPIKRAWLLAVLFCVQPAAATDPAELLTSLLTDSGETESGEGFVQDFHKRIAREPDFNRPSKLFAVATAEPLTFSTHLSAFSAHLKHDRSLQTWAEQFSVKADCEDTAIEEPDSLEAAAGLLESQASIAMVLHRSMLSERDWSRLGKDLDRVLGYLAHPQPANLSWGEKRRLRRFLARLEKADLGKLYCAAAAMRQFLRSDWLATIERLMSEHPRADQALIYQRQTALGSIVFAGRANTVHRGDDLLALFDLGGDDIHAIDSPAHFDSRPKLLVDFAGNDRYETTAPGGVGGAVGRISLLLDIAGDDLYLGDSLTQGAALLGVGMLHDRAGVDEYSARTMAQGMALAGLGVLRDDTGNDRYQLRALGQGLGMYVGLGMLADGGGDDRFRALGGRSTLYGDAGLSDAWAQGVGLGLRGMSTGGLGVLLDAGGADHYDAGVFAQGGGYYRAAGFLLDQGPGSDELTGTRYAFAWGAHGGLGYFDNHQGDDVYQSRHSVLAGLAWDYSLAWFRDRSGDDDYRVGDFSLGASAHHSTALFVDQGGSDRYAGTRPARRNEGGPNLSLFLDDGPGDNTLDEQPTSPGCRYSDDYGFEVWRNGGGSQECVKR